jgi:hypothetical protein
MSRAPSAKQVLSRTGRVIGTGLGAAALLSLGYVGLTWLRYGKVRRVGNRDPLFDSVLPDFEVRELHQTPVAAPVDITFAAARALDLQRSGIVRAIFRGRELLMGARPPSRMRPTEFLSEVLELGWRVLAEEPGRELVLGAVTQPWLANVHFRGLPPEEFTAFREPGYAKIAWSIVAEPLGPRDSIFRTETRVATTDPVSRARFRRYWSVVSPGILLIRRETVKLVRRESERRARTPTLEARGNGAGVGGTSAAKRS